MRSSVSRAYYAAFCSVRNYAIQHFSYQPKGNSRIHRELPEYLEQQNNPLWDDIADKLRELRIYRNRCDYDDHVSDLDNIVEVSLRLASEILSVV